MGRRLLTSIVVMMSMTPFILLTTSAPSGAASWSKWQQVCGKWILDIPKVDSQIETDTSTTNYTYLEIDFAELAVDGRHVTACTPSPDAKLNSLDVRYGSALYSTGLTCAEWAASKGRNALPNSRRDAHCLDLQVSWTALRDGCISKAHCLSDLG